MVREPHHERKTANENINDLAVRPEPVEGLRVITTQAPMGEDRGEGESGLPPTGDADNVPGTLTKETRDG
jgi:hypothetical protein